MCVLFRSSRAHAELENTEEWPSLTPVGKEFAYRAVSSSRPAEVRVSHSGPEGVGIAKAPKRDACFLGFQISSKAQGRGKIWSRLRTQSHMEAGIPP
jgi:hypothetical protein